MLMRFGAKLLGFGDLLCVAIIWFGDWLPQRWLWYVAVYLILKGLFFMVTTQFSSIFSWLDFLHGVYYALFLLTGIHNNVISMVFMLYLTVKGLWSVL